MNRIIASLIVTLLLTGCGDSPSTDSSPSRPNPSGGPPSGLFDAALKGDAGAIRRQIAAGANLDQRQPADGGTPLITAAVFGNVQAVKALVEGGANLNLRNNDGSTALLSAAFFARVEVVRLLLDAGADATIANNAGSTALQAVEVPFEAVKSLYDMIGAALAPAGLKLDYDQLKADRPKVAEMLRTHLAKQGATPSQVQPAAVVSPGEPASFPLAEVTEEDWATYNHDVAGWRFNPTEKILSPENVGGLVERWRFPSRDSKERIGVVHATPTVVDGEVFFGTATFPAFYRVGSDGSLRWVYRNPGQKASFPPEGQAAVDAKLGAAAGEAGILCSALVAHGAVYFADLAGWMYCLDAASGAERWKVSTRAPSFPDAHWFNILMASPILADDKVIFAGGTLEQLIGGTPSYPGCTGRGFVVALDPEDGRLLWKFNLGPKPQRFDPPLTLESSWGKYTFTVGPATSSIWCTPSYDPESNTLFFGTDVNTAPRRPTDDNPVYHTEDSCAIVALDAATGKRRWNTQINPGDVWTNAQRAYDPKTGLYKDQSIGDTPKIFTLEVDGQPTKVVGAGCKNGGFYILRASDGKLLRHTPVYTGPPTQPPAAHDPRVLALPSPVGGLQSGCATDGRTVFSNGIDAVRLGTLESPTAPGQYPTGGRVTATSIDLATERWRHERPIIPAMGGTPDKPMFRNVGDVVASGIAVANGVAYFTAVGSGKLIALNASTGELLKEIDLGPVFAGPSVSRGRVYVGGGNTLFNPGDWEAYFPKQFTGSVGCFGLPGE